MITNYQVYLILKNENPDLTREESDAAVNQVNQEDVRNIVANRYSARVLQPGDKIRGINPYENFVELQDENASAVLVERIGDGNQGVITNIEFFVDAIGKITTSNANDAIQPVLDSVIDAELANAIAESAKNYL